MSEKAPHITSTPEPVAPREPTSEELRRESFKKRLSGLASGEVQRLGVNVVDVTPYIEQIAQRISEEKVREYMNQKGLKRLIGGLMHLSEDGYRRAFYNEAMESITSNRNLMASIEAKIFGRGKHVSTSDGSSRTLDILDEVMRGAEEELIDEEQRGETFVSDEKLNGVVSELFIAHAIGKLDDRAAFEARVEAEVIPLLKGRSFSKDSSKNAASERSNLMHATNLWNWAQAFKDLKEEVVAKIKAEHGGEDEEHVRKYLKGVLQLDVQLAKQGRDVVNRAPDAKQGKLEKFISYFQKGFGDHPINRVLGWTVGNPVVQGIFVAMASRAGVRALATNLAVLGLGAVAGPAGVAIGGVVGGAAVAGTFARLRAQKELKQDRGMVARDTALGQKPGGPRSEKMKEFVHTMGSATEILKQLDAIKPGEDSANAENIIARVEAYLEIERENMIDMIHVDGSEAEKSNLKIFSLHQIQRKLKELKPFIAQHPTINELRAGYKSAALAEIRERDAAFDEYLKKESRSRALKGAALGMAGATIAAGVHHLFPAPGEWINETYEKVTSPVKRLWSYLWNGDKLPAAEVIANGTAMPRTRLQEFFYKDGTVRLPPDYVLVSDGNGSGCIANQFGKPVSDVFPVTPKGDVVAGRDFEIAMREAGLSIEKTGEVASRVDVDFASTSRVVETGVHQLREQFELPSNVSFVTQPDGTITLKDVGTGKILESGLRVGADGLFDESSVTTLKQHGWEIAQSSRVVTDTMDKTSLNKYLREHYGQGKLKRLDWHGNGTPMRKVGGSWVVSVDGVDPIVTHTRPHLPATGGWKMKHIGGRWVGADGKELMLRLQGTAEDRVLSLKDMIKTSIEGPVNPDGSIDTRYANIADQVFKKDFARAASNFRLRVFVGDNYWKSGEAFELPIGPDGELHLSKNDPLYGVLFDEKGNLKATVEAVVHDQHRPGYHTLATVVRHGDGAGVVSHVQSYAKLDHADTVYARDIYTVKPEAWIPSVPTPFFARKAMEMPEREGNSVQVESLSKPKQLPTPKEVAKKEEEKKDVKKPKEPVQEPVEDEENKFEDVIAQYELAHGTQSTKMRADLEQKLENILKTGEVSEIVWKKPFEFSGSAGQVPMFIEHLELLTLLSENRPERITIVFPDTFFKQEKIPNEMVGKFITEYNKQFGILFSHYGVRASAVLKTGKVENSVSSNVGEKEYPLALSPEIAQIGFEYITHQIDISLEKTRADLFNRMYRAASGAGKVKPMLWIVDSKTMKAMVNEKDGYPDEQSAISQLQVELQAIADRAEKTTGTRVVVGVVKNGAQVHMTRAKEGLLKRAREAFAEGPRRNRSTEKSIPETRYISKGKAANLPNQDAFLADDARRVYGVFDGVGGEAYGEIASQAARDSFEKDAEAINLARKSGNILSVRKALRISFGNAQEAVHTALIQQGSKDGATTAIVSVPFRGTDGKRYITTASVGDSRAYIVQADGSLMWISRDLEGQSLDLERRLRNVTSQAELDKDPELSAVFEDRNIISSSLSLKDGTSSKPVIKTFEIPKGARAIVLLSDGITDNLTEGEIEQAARSSDPAEQLYKDAYARSRDKDHRRHKTDDMTAVWVPLKN